MILSLLLIYSASSFGADCSRLLDGILYESQHGRSPLHNLRLNDLAKNDARFCFALRFGPAETCIGEGHLRSGSWRLRFDPTADANRPWVMTEARNNHVLTGPDPVYGQVTGTIEQSLTPQSTAAPDVHDYENVENDLANTALLGAEPLAGRYLDPRVLNDLVDLVTTSSFEPRTVVVPASNYELDLREVARHGNLSQFLAQTGFPEGSRVDVTAQTTAADGARQIRLIGTTGARVDLSFKPKRGFAVIETVRVTRQIRRALTRITFTVGQGDLAASIERYNGILAREHAERLAKIDLDNLRRDAAAKASDGTYLEATPDLFGLPDHGSRLRIFALSDERIQATRTAIEFRMADAPRPQVILIKGVAFAITYMRSGVLTAKLISGDRESAIAPDIDGTYDKTPEKVTLKDGSEAIVTMLAVTIHEDAHHVLVRAQEIAKGVR